ncbi:unnamed protein product [Owenia fusiformis]|uniref:Helicase C-terminal domain-containing protein n=1 Tax=Owenia fusiformis TaxID=6347 RepID=A0A8S4N6Y0_OWEFU|nr:unnamed protein product [Owenia fusiformis]
MEKWEKGKDYYRFDGSTNAKLRKKYQLEFSKNKRARLFLISTKAGSLGINLDKANRVIIFDASWNPSHDVQSIFRVYRFGQVKDVFVYRFLAQGTMEEKIYERQIEKLSLSQRVIDEHQIERHFNSNDLKELYNFQPDRLEDKKERPTPKLPKDVILTEILKSKKDHIVSYQEHDSLLEHLVEEELNEDERKAAWEEYENEKKGMMRYGGFGAIGQNLSSGNSAFGLQQLPRVVQEILKYNPNIPPQELQTRLQAFLKLQTPQQGLQQRPVQSSAFPGGNYLRGPQTQGVAIQPRPSYATTTIPNPNLIGNPPVRIGQPAVYNPSTQNIIRVSQPGLPSRLPGVGTIPGLGAGPMNVIRVNASNGTVQVNGASK